MLSIHVQGQPDTLLNSETNRLGLVLSGGAARGFAHIGVLRAFEESGIEIDCLSGSSMGALVGLFYASGKTPDEMLEIAMQVNQRKLKAVGPFHLGKAGVDYIEELLKQYVTVTTFEELQKPLYVCVTNFQSGTCEFVSSGIILPFVKASAAIPIKFDEQEINGTSYVDGGMTNNLPVEALRGRCKTVIGISVNPVVYKNNKMGFREKISRLTEILLNENEARRIELCDYHLEISDLGEFDFEDYHHAREIHDMGYKAAKLFIAENPELLKYKSRYDETESKKH